MPGPVQCPTCGADGTEASNAYLQQVLSSGVKVQEQPASEVGASPLPPPAPTGKKRANGDPNLTLGTIGAVVAALVGMMVWYLIIKVINFEIGIIAWGLGGVVGIACRTLGGGYSQTLGFIAGACALVAIVGGEYLATKSAFDAYADEFIETSYQSQLGFAQRATEAKDDQELKAILADYYSEEGAILSPEDIAAEDLQEFKDAGLPGLEAFVGGSPTRAEFQTQMEEELNSPEMKALVLRESVSLWTLLWLFLGVSTAYKLGTGETE